ncbi:MAG: META domain-containing protein [Pyrinomonadaceae bacterium]
MLKRRTFSLITVILLAFAAISASASDLPQGEWKLKSYNFRQKIAFPIDTLEITLNIKAASLGGRSGCNIYGGSYSFDDGNLKVGNLMSTMMACEEPAMQFERIFSTTIQNATEFSERDGELTITDPKTANFLRFERVVKVSKCGTMFRTQ